MAKRYGRKSRKAHKSTAKGCVPRGIALKRNGRLKKGFRWAKSRKGCILRARKSK